jgi:hypothetical protein
VQFFVTLILCPRDIPSTCALSHADFLLSAQTMARNWAAIIRVPLFEGLASFLGRDGAMLVEPASSEEAVTHHAVGKQKKEECQDNYKQELSNPQPHGPSFFRRPCFQISCHQSRCRNT